MSTDETPFKIVGSRVWLSRTARQLASMHPMSEHDMEKHLLEQHRLRELGIVQPDGES